MVICIALVSVFFMGSSPIPNVREMLLIFQKVIDDLYPYTNLLKHYIGIKWPVTLLNTVKHLLNYMNEMTISESYNWLCMFLKQYDTYYYFILWHVWDASDKQTFSIWIRACKFQNFNWHLLLLVHVYRVLKIVYFEPEFNKLFLQKSSLLQKSVFLLLLLVWIYIK